MKEDVEEEEEEEKKTCDGFSTLAFNNSSVDWLRALIFEHFMKLFLVNKQKILFNERLSNCWIEIISLKSYLFIDCIRKKRALEFFYLNICVDCVIKSNVFFFIKLLFCYVHL